MGGKHNLSGWINFHAAGRKLHNGNQQPEVMELKMGFDPQQIPNPGFAGFVQTPFCFPAIFRCFPLVLFPFVLKETQ
jgi:hypothetical protein